MYTKKSLKIKRLIYRDLLSLNLKHKYYFSAFNSLRKQRENFSEVCMENAPALHDFSSQTVTYNIELPYPVSSPLIVHEDKDHCIALLTEKVEYKKDLDRFLTYYKRDKKWLTKSFVTRTKYAALPKYLIDMCEGKVADPDPCFSGNYNWYYTGGVLDSVTVADCTYFVHPNTQNQLCLTYSENTGKAFPLNGMKTAPIFNIKAYGSNSNFFLTVRQRNDVHLLKLLKEGNGLSARILLSEYSKDVPYIDIKFRGDEVCVLELNHKLKVIDLEDKRNSLKHEFSKCDNLNASFAQTDYYDANSIIFMDRNSLRVLDKRSLSEKIFILQNDYFKCDDFCAMSISKADNNYLFTSSVHNIFKFDVRQMKFVKKWTHMLSTPPLMMKSKEAFGEEIFFISTQNYAERVLLCSNKAESNLVQLVPNNMDTLRKCNLSYSFNLRGKFEERLKFSVAGIEIMQPNEGEGLTFFTTNSNGDIFANRVSQIENSSTEPLSNLNNWIHSLPTEPTVLEVTGLREMSKWKFAFQKFPSSDKFSRYTKENPKRLDLLSEIDMYDTDMAIIWQPDNVLNKGVGIAPSMASDHKVAQWLHTTEDLQEDSSDAE